ncbi:uncharacterized protein A1O9_10507 [Exophiala aquamarina CBS 119918]|uniref:FAD/NAD(P)-binding domain-containing protein n=1 Tax=Exophiala aquamarina CBS 119918 TaxID=1182545 RepID=A0A072P1H2_9EURO|nr:uncharacterized protein A1O9_10507 [Exophiala aquamarina CBS 119918]KEF53532.1 hypothetical protein A1O9_10507 [Exophiala aquamarina CBS 119918]
MFTENGLLEPYEVQVMETKDGSKSSDCAQVNAAVAKYPDVKSYASPNDTAIRDAPSWTPQRKLKVITIGAGFSGLIFAHKLQHEHGEFHELVDHEIYEARENIGATWLAFPFDPKPDWTQFYATGADIPAYIESTVKNGTWIAIEKTFVEYADILVSGQGVLNNWRWPDIEGLSTFEGDKCHSAAWDHDFDYSEKTIAVIGNGSSGVQIIPKLAELPKTKVIAFQRTPNYVSTPLPPGNLMGREGDVSNNPTFTEEDKKRFRDETEFHRDYRRRTIHQINSAFKMFLKGSTANEAITDAARKQMTMRLKNDADLCSNLIPDWGLGCRRITPGEGYLESLTRANVKLVNSSVVKATANSITTADGQTFDVDVIVCATGFDVSLRLQWNMVGRKNVDLRKEWEVDPESYGEWLNSNNWLDPC